MLPEEETDMGNLNKEFVVIQDALQLLVFRPALSNLQYNGMARLHHNGVTEDLLHLDPNALDCTLLFDMEPECPASESVHFLCLPMEAVSICLCLCTCGIFPAGLSAPESQLLCLNLSIMPIMAGVEKHMLTKWLNNLLISNTKGRRMKSFRKLDSEVASEEILRELIT